MVPMSSAEFAAEADDLDPSLLSMFAAFEMRAGLPSPPHVLLSQSAPSAAVGSQGQDMQKDRVSTTLPITLDHAGIECTVARPNIQHMQTFAASHFFKFRLNADCLYLKGSEESGLYIALVFRQDSVPMFPIHLPHVSICHGLYIGESWNTLWRLKHSLATLLSARTITVEVYPQGDELTLTSRSELTELVMMLQEIISAFSIAPPPQQVRMFSLVTRLHFSWHVVGFANVK